MVTPDNPTRSSKRTNRIPGGDPDMTLDARKLTTSRFCPLTRTVQRIATLLLITGMLWMTTGAENSEAQTGSSQRLVSNTHTTWSGSVITVGPNGTTAIAQPFTTGTNAGGYFVKQITFRINDTDDKKNLVLQGSIRQSKQNGLSSDDHIITMTSDILIYNNAHNVYEAPSNSAVLAPNTRYFMVLECINGSCGTGNNNKADLRFTYSGDEDDQGENDWSLENNSAGQVGGIWAASNLIPIVSLDGWYANRVRCLYPTTSPAPELCSDSPNGQKSRYSRV